MKNVNDEFVEMLNKLSPIEFLGLAKFLGVRIVTDDFDKETQKATPREANDILADVLNMYSDMTRAERRELVRILRQSLKKKKNKQEEE